MRNFPNPLADRIASNGDFANKTGTYGVAVSAAHHKVPFYPEAPFTTIDLSCPDGAGIPIEERAGAEVRGAAGSFGKVVWAPGDAQTYNPAFDVTPHNNVSAIITQFGIIDHPDTNKVTSFFLEKGVIYEKEKMLLYAKRS